MGWRRQKDEWVVDDRLMDGEGEMDGWLRGVTDGSSVNICI